MSRTIVLAALVLCLGLGAATARAADLSAGSPLGEIDPILKAELDKMAAQHQHDHPAATPAATAAPAQPVDADMATIVSGVGAFSGYFAHPSERTGKPTTGAEVSPAPLPGIIVIHEWWGLNDNVKAMTRRLAGEGYQALAVDLYGGAVADTPEAAKKLMGAVMAHREAAAAILRRADEFLKQRGAPKVGVVGWCFGGAWSLAAALDLQQEIDAAVVYYGQPEKDRARLERLHAPLLGFFGADDQSIPAAAVREMEATLKQLSKQVEIHVYDGAGHAFANPSGTNYRPAAAEDAWRRTVAFFKQYLKA